MAQFQGRGGELRCGRKTVGRVGAFQLQFIPGGQEPCYRVSGRLQRGFDKFHVRNGKRLQVRLLIKPSHWVWDDVPLRVTGADFSAEITGEERTERVNGHK